MQVVWASASPSDLEQGEEGCRLCLGSLWIWVPSLERQSGEE